VKFNAICFEKVLEKLETFWKKYILSYMISQLLDGNKESLVEKLGKKNDNIVVVYHGNFVYDWMMRMLLTRM
jgi:hypothetical protein